VLLIYNQIRNLTGIVVDRIVVILSCFFCCFITIVFFCLLGQCIPYSITRLTNTFVPVCVDIFCITYIFAVGHDRLRFLWKAVGLNVINISLELIRRRVWRYQSDDNSESVNRGRTDNTMAKKEKQRSLSNTKYVDAHWN
jgi:hypothetical protein